MLRAVPSSSTVPGMMLCLVPPAMRPTVTTAGVAGSTRRLTMDCRAVTICEAASTGSRQLWGRAACPPRPLTVIRKLSEAAIIGPTLIPIFPVARTESMCRPKTASALGFSKAPSRIIPRAPPGGVSSPGWNRNLTVPGRPAPLADRILAAPSSMAQWASWPQACIRPGILER